MSETPEPGDVVPSRRRPWLRIAIAVGVLALGAYLVVSRADELATAVEELSPGRFALSGLLAVAGTILIQQVWLALLHGLGTRPAGRDAAAVFFVSQLGKYLPGSVWPVVAQMEFGRRWGTSRAVMLAANVLLLGMVTASGIVVGAALLPWSSAEGLRSYWWLVLLLLPLLAGLHPRTVPGVFDLVLRRLGREPLGIRLRASGLLASAGWMLAAWAVLGAHVAVLGGAFGDVGAREIVAATGGMALAWAAGIAFIPAPAGAGVRDAILVLTLAPLLGSAEALTVAIASRLLLLLADVLLAGVGALARRRLSAA